MPNEIQLTDDEQELEAALRTLRPAAAQIDVAAASQAAGPNGKRRVLAVAAAIVAGVGLWAALGSRDRAPEIEPVVVAVDHAPVQPPTLLAYRQALRQSPAELGKLLARQSARTAASRQLTPVNSLSLGSFSLKTPKLDSPLGEL